MEPSVVSHYQLLDRLGEGGMGVVYRARDLRLGREVAIKLLRKDASTTADWRARFEREARLASALQHPHISTIHELGEHEGQPFIAMERLEGRTVRQLIEAGPIPMHRVLNLARQIADALDAAHRRGIIHRDIKPANLFVTYGDHLKVLDFGLAKTTSADSKTATAIPHTPSSPTIAAKGTPDLTATGVAIGTAAYMSPEQAHGQPLDARSDLFSLGGVLYEMATGRRAFGGDDLALIAMRIVNGILVPPRAVNPDDPRERRDDHPQADGDRSEGSLPDGGRSAGGHPRVPGAVGSRRERDDDPSPQCTGRTAFGARARNLGARGESWASSRSPASRPTPG